MKTAAVICHARFLDLAAFGETLQAAMTRSLLTRSTWIWSSCSVGR